jgi:hypothetical protein
MFPPLPTSTSVFCRTHQCTCLTPAPISLSQQRRVHGRRRQRVQQQHRELLPQRVVRRGHQRHQRQQPLHVVPRGAVQPHHRRGHVHGLSRGLLWHRGGGHQSGGGVYRGVLTGLRVPRWVLQWHCGAVWAGHLQRVWQRGVHPVPRGPVRKRHHVEHHGVQRAVQCGVLRRLCRWVWLLCGCCVNAVCVLC